MVDGQVGHSSDRPLCRCVRGRSRFPHPMYINGRAHAVIRREVLIAHRCEYCCERFATRHSFSFESCSDKSVLLDPEGARQQARDRVEALFRSQVLLAQDYTEIHCPGCEKISSKVLASIEASSKRGVPKIAWIGLGVFVFVNLCRRSPGRPISETFDAIFLIPLAIWLGWIFLRWHRARNWPEEFRRRLTDIPDQETIPLSLEDYERISRQGYQLLRDD